MIGRQAYSKASDIYSFGMIMWEMITWQMPWQEFNTFQVSLAQHVLTKKHTSKGWVLEVTCNGQVLPWRSAIISGAPHQTVCVYVCACAEPRVRVCAAAGSQGYCLERRLAVVRESFAAGRFGCRS